MCAFGFGFGEAGGGGGRGGEGGHAAHCKFMRASLVSTCVRESRVRLLFRYEVLGWLPGDVAGYGVSAVSGKVLNGQAQGGLAGGW